MKTTKQEIKDIQFKQILDKQKELLFVAENVDLFIQELWKKREESLVDYFDSKTDVYELWRGNNIDFEFRDTGNSDTIYARVQKKLGIKKQKKIRIME
tara:strand:- start:293 stop:586 length:294 start_codon:yes stop_codon:yes gene_type:complete